MRHQTIGSTLMIDLIKWINDATLFTAVNLIPASGTEQMPLALPVGALIARLTTHRSGIEKEVARGTLAPESFDSG